MKKIWLWALVAFNAVDVITTLIAVTHLGSPELNPLVNLLISVHPLIWVLWKIFGLLWVVLITEEQPQLWDTNWIKLAALFYAVIAGLQILAILGF